MKKKTNKKSMRIIFSKVLSTRIKFSTMNWSLNSWKHGKKMSSSAGMRRRSKRSFSTMSSSSSSSNSTNTTTSVSVASSVPGSLSPSSSTIIIDVNSQSDGTNETRIKDDSSLMIDDETSMKMKEMQRDLLAQGYSGVIGVDEAGRGPLAGPVVVCACQVPLDWHSSLIRDSKTLSEADRNQAYSQLINDDRIAYSLSVCNHEIIDELNILGATMKGMRDCIDEMKQKNNLIEIALIDGNRDPSSLSSSKKTTTTTTILKNDEINEQKTNQPKQTPHKKVKCLTVIKGDSKVYCIAAASIIAKVTRDRMMRDYHDKWPQYRFDRHKGYPTALHRSLLYRFGPCPIHRQSFKPVRDALEINQAKKKNQTDDESEKKKTKPKKKKQNDEKDSQLEKSELLLNDDDQRGSHFDETTGLRRSKRLKLIKRCETGLKTML